MSRSYQNAFKCFACRVSVCVCVCVCARAQDAITKTGESSSIDVTVPLEKVPKEMTCTMTATATNAAGLTSNSVSSVPLDISLERSAPQAIKWHGYINKSSYLLSHFERNAFIYHLLEVYA